MDVDPINEEFTKNLKVYTQVGWGYHSSAIIKKVKKLDLVIYL